MWQTGPSVKCNTCDRGSEMTFNVDLGYGKAVLCPVCMKQSADAALLEAEALGMAVPLDEALFQTDTASPELLVQNAREALLGTLLDVCKRHGVPLKELLANPLVAAELGLAPTEPADEPVASTQGPGELYKRLRQQHHDMSRGIFGEGE